MGLERIVAEMNMLHTAGVALSMLMELMHCETESWLASMHPPKNTITYTSLHEELGWKLEALSTPPSLADNALAVSSQTLSSHSCQKLSTSHRQHCCSIRTDVES